jgi:hypothetical protein
VNPVGIADFEEYPVFIESAGETLVGIVAEVSDDSIGLATLYLRGGGQDPSSGRNQTAADLCRLLSASGVTTMRFDYHGAGDSTGVVDGFRHDEPFTGDVLRASEWLRDRGSDRLALAGECFGARTALACSGIPGVEAMVLLGTHVRDAEKDGVGTRALVRHRSLVGYTRRAFQLDVLRQLIRPAGRRRYAAIARGVLRAESARRASRTRGAPSPPWVSTAFLHDLREAVREGIRILFVNGTGDPGFEDFERARSGDFGSILETAGPQIEIARVEGRVGAWADLAVQTPVREMVASWLVGIAASPRAAASRARARSG